MTQEIAYNRRLAPFPETWNKDEPLHIEEWLDDLLSADGGGYLVHGGPGSGKSAVMNYLRTEINEEEGWGYVIGPLNMAAYRGETRLNVVLSDLAAQILDQASQHPAGPQIPELPSDAINYLPVRTSGLVSQALTTLSTSHSGRTILLLDNYDLVHPLVAVRLAGHLRTWYDDHKQHFTFVLTTATDLDELRAVDVYSPLVNVCDAHLLLDLDNEQTRRFAQRQAEVAGVGQEIGCQRRLLGVEV